MKVSIIGHSVQKKPILKYSWDQKSPVNILMLGGVHGDEVEGVNACYGVLEKLMTEYPFKFNFDLVPCLNMDGFFHQTRQNANGVDLNRNLPTKDWTSEFVKVRYYPGKTINSEPENQALTALLEQKKYSFIYTLHSWKPMLNVNGDCSLVQETLNTMTGYDIVPDIGYPTPGSLGAYGAIDNNIPTLTYEFEKGMEHLEIIEKHVPALIESLHSCEKKFL